MNSRLVPIGLLILAVAIFFGYVNPTLQGSVAESNKQIKGYESALVASKKFAAKEAQLATARAAIPADQLSRLEAFLPDGVNNVQLILDLNALAARSGITLSNFSVDSSAAATPTQSGNQPLSLGVAQPVDSLDISLSATGSYAAFRTFLQNIESSLRPMDVISVQVNSGANGVYTYTMALRIYWLR